VQKPVTSGHDVTRVTQSADGQRRRGTTEVMECSRERGAPTSRPLCASPISGCCIVKLTMYCKKCGRKDVTRCNKHGLVTHTLLYDEHMVLHAGVASGQRPPSHALRRLFKCHSPTSTQGLAPAHRFGCKLLRQLTLACTTQGHSMP
jgi:hypothetical protein